MSRQDELIDEYYSRNRDKLIDCPFQSGNLRISEKACIKRRFAAGRNTEWFYKRENLFAYFVSQGLLRCRQCPMVADVVEAMASYRTYRPALGIDAALEEIKKNRRILYHPEVVKKCRGLFKEKGFGFK